MTKVVKRRTQQERREESRRNLIKAATQLFGTQGYSGTTMIQIGKAAGVSHGLVTYHFGTKKDCFKAVLENIWETTERANTARHEQGITRLDTLCRIYLTGPDEKRVTGRAVYVAIAESISSTPELRDLTAKNDEIFRRGVVEALKEAKASGEIGPDVRPEEQAVLVIALLRGIVLQRLINKRAVSLVRIIPAALSMVHASLGIHNRD